MSLVDQALSRIPASDQLLISHVEFKEAQGNYAPMWYDERDQSINYFPSDTNVGALVHEIGHAIDHALGWVSHTGAFKVIAKQYDVPTYHVRGRGSDSKYEEAWAAGYAALYGGATPMWWPGDSSDLALVIREGRTHASRLGSSWRGVSDSPIWREHDVVIMTQKRGRRNYYELYILGQDIRHFPRLDEAKQAVEHDFGSLNWERKSLSVDTYHYYFGWTTEFSDPAVVYVASIPS